MLSRALDVEMAQARSRGLDDDKLGAAVATYTPTYHTIRLPFFIRNTL